MTLTGAVVLSLALMSAVLPGLAVETASRHYLDAGLTLSPSFDGDIASLARILLFAVCGLWPRIFQRIPHPIHLNTDGVSRLLWFTRLYDSAKGQQ